MSAKQHYLDRLDAAKEGRRGAAVPVAFWQHHPVADQQADSLADATCAFQDRFDCDLVKITPASSFQLRDLGQTDAWTGDPIGRRDFGPSLVRQPEDWLRIAQMRVGDRHLAEHLRAARLIRARVPAHIPVLQSIFDPLFQIRILAGDLWQAHCRDCPENIAAALAALTARTRRLVADFRAAGVDGIFLAVQHAGAAAGPGDSFAERGLPQDLDCLAAAGPDSLNFVHLHGDGIPAGLLDAYPGTTVHFSFDANPALDAGRPARPEVLLSGGMAPSRLARLTAEEIAAETQRLIGGMRGRGFTLSAGCALHQATPERNILAAIAAARGGTQ
ncbi:MAG: uroporphyrinogen decarboxylase family protein [Pseudodonghicola sp.]